MHIQSSDETFHSQGANLMSYKTDSKILYHICDDLIPSVVNQYVLSMEDSFQIEQAKKILRKLAKEIEDNDKIM